MEKIREEIVGGRTLRLVKMADGFAGIVIVGKDRLGPFHGDDPDALWTRLLEEGAKADPRYFGYKGAIARFLHIFEDGFAGVKYVRWERDYKLDAKRILDEAIPLTVSAEAEPDHCRPALRAFQRTNLLSQFEKARVAEILKSASGPGFIRASAAFAKGEHNSALKELERLMRPHGQPSWPAATYLAFLWNPERNMFLKPTATLDFAQRVGHRFAENYSSELRADTYLSLLDLADRTERETARLKPRDRIDIQSFIWTVGNYTDRDIAEVHAASV